MNKTQETHDNVTRDSIKELRQDLDRILKALDVLYNVRCTLGLAVQIIESLDVPFYRGLVLHKAHPIGLINDAEDSLRGFYQRLMEIRSDIETKLPAEVGDELPF